jgi:tRNA (adenine37-N6)-methyltransferase
MNDLALKPIGIIHSSFRQACDAPVQGAMAKDAEGWVEVLPEFRPGLRDLEGFDRIWLFYWFDRAPPAKLVLKPYLDDKEHGVFATRSPCRPNPIGLSCVRLLGIEEERLRLRGLDILDGTPLLDIKPYVPVFDCFESGRIGWLEGKDAKAVHADGRFERR